MAIDNTIGLNDQNFFDNSGDIYMLNAGSDTASSAVPATGNSILDGLGAFTGILGDSVKAYGSFLEAQAVANAAQRQGITPQAVVGSLPTVPLNGAQAQIK